VKTIFLVRHGESRYNVNENSVWSQAEKFDSPLTDKGLAQAAQLRNHPDLATAEVAVVSPLTRAIQTLRGAFPMAFSPKGTLEDNLRQAQPGSIPTIVWPVMREHLTDSCDIGTGASELQKRWQELDFSQVPEAWWYTDPSLAGEGPEASRTYFRECGFFEPVSDAFERADMFVRQLLSMPQQVIVCFGHADFFNYVCERHFDRPDVWMQNTEVLRLEKPVVPV